MGRAKRHPFYFPAFVFQIARVIIERIENQLFGRQMNCRRLNYLASAITRLFVAGLLLFTAQAVLSQSELSTVIDLSGVVVDQNGSVIKGARIGFRGSDSLSTETVSGADGTFKLSIGRIRSGIIYVSANGFAESETAWNHNNGKERLTITLRPAAVLGQVVVSAAGIESRIDETPASIAVISSRDLANSPNSTLDDSLRQIPGFQLFRRTSSRVANPTAQGVSLRGLGASGASRALVLADGIPLNDPFGGWIYWGRVPRESIDRVEVLRGGASSLYGSGALGGVVNILRRRAAAPALSLSASAGSQSTAETSLFGGTRWKGWGSSAAAEGFRTGGYIPVAEATRGPVDVNADSARLSLNATVDRKFGEIAEVFGRTNYFAEERGNGTREQTNRTHIRNHSVVGSFTSTAAGSFSAKLFGGTQVYDQTFTAVAPDRTSENLLRIQRVPARVLGLSGQWSRAVGAANQLVAGVDASAVRGFSDETVIVQGIATSLVSSGGRERTFAVFAEDVVQIGRKTSLAAKIRYDHWKNFDASSTTLSLVNAGQVSVIVFPDRTESAWSPQFSVLYRGSEKLAVFGSVYRSFRAPTLNELYRSFRVGDVLTRANENLRAERLTGGEGGVLVESKPRNLSMRGTAFWSEVDRSIANVSLSVTPSLITRQRQNLGRTRSRGLEFDLELRPFQNLRLTAGYLLLDAKVVQFPGSDSLAGRMIPQIARHQYSFQAVYEPPKLFDITVRGRGTSRQFDDDQNLFPLGSYFALDARITRRIRNGFEIFAAFENVLNQRYEVGRTPVVSLGSPATARFGFRVSLGRN